MVEEYVGCRETMGVGLYNMWLTEQRIVRCRDCRHYNEYHAKCHRAALVIFDDKTIWTDKSNECLSVTDAEPDGFCAWGERRDS